MSCSLTIPSSSPCTVLFMDDNPEHLMFWSTALTDFSSNYSVLKASSIKDGLELFRGQKVNCVVLDLDFPDSSGFQFLLDVVPDRDRPTTAIVFLTQLPHPNLREMALHNGAQAYLVKQSTSADALDKAIQKGVSSVAVAVGQH